MGGKISPLKPLPTRCEGAEWPHIVWAGWLGTGPEHGVRIYVAADTAPDAARQISALERDLRPRTRMNEDMLTAHAVRNQTYHHTYECFILGEGARKWVHAHP